MFYIQLWFTNNGCKGEYWYLACEFWYFMLFPIIASLYAKNRASGVVFLSFMILGSMIQNGYSSWYYDKAVMNTFNIPPSKAVFVHDVYSENGTLEFTYAGKTNS